MRALVLVLALLAGEAQADEGRARKTLEAAGYTEITDEASSLVGCSKHDNVLTSRKFKARAPGGKLGMVRVCCGLLAYAISKCRRTRQSAPAATGSCCESGAFW